jgi:hypothetical protein
MDDFQNRLDIPLEIVEAPTLCSAEVLSGNAKKQKSLEVKSKE